MTIEEAKKQLRELILDREDRERILDTENLKVSDSVKEIYRKDIEALKKAVEVLEKQIPKKPLAGIDFIGNKFRICCECSAIVQDGEWKANYCPDCGQKIDWSDNSDE